MCWLWQHIYEKLGTMQRRLAWILFKNARKIHESVPYLKKKEKLLTSVCCFLSSSFAVLGFIHARQQYLLFLILYSLSHFFRIPVVTGSTRNNLFLIDSR